jgi:hypothetical protein
MLGYLPDHLLLWASIVWEHPTEDYFATLQYFLPYRLDHLYSGHTNTETANYK